MLAMEVYLETLIGKNMFLACQGEDTQQTSIRNFMQIILRNEHYYNINDRNVD